MTEPTPQRHVHGDDDCARALSQVQAFLHQELPVCDADLIRAHLDACEACLENFDVENAITQLVRRCCPPQQASATLRMRIVSLSVHLDE